jgi:hypothetical protein
MPISIPLTLRLLKGSKLTFAELDQNFINLRNAINFVYDSDTYVTGGTYNPSTVTLDFSGSNGFNPFSVDVSTLLDDTNTFTTGATFNGTTIEFDRNDLSNAYSVDISSVNTDNYVTGGTYNSITESIDFSGTTLFPNFSVDVSSLLDDTNTFVTGFTFNPSNYELTIDNNNNISLTTDLSILAGDLFVTGGTYNPSNGIATFSNNSGGTFQVSGFLTGMTDFYTTGATLNGTVLGFDRNDLLNAYSVDLSSLVFTGNTSGDCITDLYVSNLYGCSPITVWDSIQSSGSTASGEGSFAFGFGVEAFGDYSHAEGFETLAIGIASHAEGFSTSATTTYSHAEGYITLASGIYSHAEGSNTIASGEASHAEGLNTLATNRGSHAEGEETVSIGLRSHAEGFITSATTTNAHAEGFGTLASGNNSHAEGYLTIASGVASHAGGDQTIASGDNSHAKGKGTEAIGGQSHAEGNGTISIGEGSHAEGNGTISIGDYSHAEGYGTITSGDYQHVQGMWNVTGDTTQGAFIIGNGTDNLNRSNLIFAAGNEVNILGKTITTNLQITSGATNGYVLTSDSLGNATWQTPSITGDTNIYNTDGTLLSNRFIDLNGNFIGWQDITGDSEFGINIDDGLTKIGEFRLNGNEFFATVGDNQTSIGRVYVDNNQVELAILSSNTNTVITKMDVTTSGVEINGEYILPNTDGNNGQVLTTDGLGTTYWSNPNGDYVEYRANLTQTGTTAPIATELGIPTLTGGTWSYDSTGYYYFYKPGAFSASTKVEIEISNAQVLAFPMSNSGFNLISASLYDDDYIEVKTSFWGVYQNGAGPQGVVTPGANGSSPDDAMSNDILNNTRFCVRVWS